MESSCVFVQLGQCGTQLGHHLIDTIYSDATASLPNFHPGQNEKYRCASLSTFFSEMKDGAHQARSVTIDMEPKVVNWALDSARKNGKWTYPKNMQLCRKSGSGNNWSFGFQVHGPKCEDDVLNLLRKESEKCDRLSGFIVMMSLAGGTGSGVGSHITQLLHDHFPHSVRLNPIVMPYKAGEVAVQNYNAMLTLSCVLSSVNGSIILHNDNLHRICTQSLSISKVSVDDLNSVGAHQLASVLQPSHTSTDNSLLGQPTRDILFDIVRSTWCHSQYKLLTLRSVPHTAERSIAFSSFTWSGLLKHMRQMHLTNFFIDEGMDWQVKVSNPCGDEDRPHNKSVGNLLFLRGAGVGDLGCADLGNFKDDRLYTTWVPPSERCHIWTCTRPFRKYEKSVSMLSNNSMCTAGLDCVIKKAWDMFGAKAYLHQYTKHGLEEEDFLNSFVTVENIINSYKKL